MRKFAILGTVLALALTTTLIGCTSQDTIVVGSKIDTEGSLLAQMMILMLRDGGFRVTDKSQTGATAIVKAALENGEIDMYPEYTGNGAFFFGEAESPVWKNAKQGYERVKKLDMEANNIVWLSPAPANNTWAIAVRSDLAAKHGLVSLADLAALITADPDEVMLMGSEEFATSPAALPSFQEAYGFVLDSQHLLTIAGGNTIQTEKAAGENTDGVNAAMAYGTDGTISAFNLVVLTDPLGAHPVYEPAPRVRGEIMEKYPEIADILNPVFESLTMEKLQELNGRIGVDGEKPVDVARDYLESAGFLK